MDGRMKNMKLTMEEVIEEAKKIEKPVYPWYSGFSNKGFSIVAIIFWVGEILLRFEKKSRQ
jgi:hypothetical protein